MKLPATTLAYYSMVWLAESGMTDVIDALFSSTSSENMYYGVYCLGQAFSDFRNCDVKSGGEHLREGLYQTLQENFKNIPDQDLLLRNAFLLENVVWPGEELFQKPILKIASDNRFDNASRTWCVAFDRANYECYFDRFVESVRAHDESANVFAIFINPDDEMLAAGAKVAGVALASVQYDGRWLAEFRKLSLMMVAGDILGQCDHSIVFLDPNAVITQEHIETIAQYADTPIGICDTGKVFPTEMIDSRLVVSRHSPEAFIFWQSAEYFVLRGFARKGPLVGLSEAGLLAASSEMRTNGYGITDLGHSVTNALYCDAHAFHEAEMTNNHYKAASVTPEKRITVIEEHNADRVGEEASKYKNITLAWDLSSDAEKVLKFIERNKSNATRSLEEIVNFSDKADAETLNNLFLDFRHLPGMRSADLTYSVLKTMVEQGRGEKVRSVFEATNEHNPFFGIYRIGQSFNDCMNWEIEECAHNMREGFYHCLANEVKLDNLGFIAQNAYLLEAVTWPETESFVFPRPIAKLVHKNLFEQTPYALFTGFSPEYVRRYLRERLQNIRRECGRVNVLVHLLNPDNGIIDEYDYRLASGSETWDNKNNLRQMR